jgi:hypothetical protein
MIEIIIAILIIIVAWLYFMQKEKFINIPEVTENLDNVHVFALSK